MGGNSGGINPSPKEIAVFFLGGGGPYIYGRINPSPGGRRRAGLHTPDLSHVCLGMEKKKIKCECNRRRDEQKKMI